MNRSRDRNSGEKVITTWLYMEKASEGGIYPQVRGQSSTPKFHDVYKRCLVTFFHSARAANVDARLYLFSNVDIRKSIRKIDRQLVSIFEKLSVEIIITNYTFRPPTEQLTWRNQFYVLNILEELLTRVNQNDLCLVLDSDIIWSGMNSTLDLWEKLELEGSLTMLPITSTAEIINGYSLDDLNNLSQLLGHSKSSHLSYAGGEFIALRGDYLKLVVEKSKQIWINYHKLLENSQIEFIEEAHFLSIVYSQIEIQFGSGDEFIRRIWTQVFHYKNRSDADANLACWHLPAEKRFGIRRVANLFLNDRSLKWPEQGSKEWIKVRDSLGALKTPLLKAVMDFTRSVLERLVRKLDGFNR